MRSCLPAACSIESHFVLAENLARFAKAAHVDDVFGGEHDIESALDRGYQPHMGDRVPALGFGIFKILEVARWLHAESLHIGVLQQVETVQSTRHRKGNPTIAG